jgi:DNA repair photolyase
VFVRWDNLTIGEDEGARLPGYRDPAVIRRFDAPEALDMRFYEIHAKSALNRVPKASKMPFRWTINPYRGCSHACVYCISGDALILMADGSRRPLAELRVGDEIYGTQQSEGHRRLARTQVLAHWSAVKPAYRVALDGGTELIASADHRFLTGSGWKHVTGSRGRSESRPHLAAGDSLVGAVRLGSPSEIDGMELSDEQLTVISIEPLNTTMRLYDITTGTGDFIANGVVSHNCFARPTHTYLDFDAGRDFEREIVVKVNVPEVVRAELARPGWKGEHVAMGTNTDPYQWVESRYKLMPGIWEAMRDARNPCSILTKSPLLLRDLDLMKEIAAVTDIHANLSIPTLDAKAWRATEPHTPHPKARLEAVAELNRAGIPCGVLIAPLMPGINDAPEQVEPLLEAAAEAGATGIGGIALHLRGEVRQIYFDWLRAYRPDLIPLYEELYARGAYAPTEERRRLAELVRREETAWPSRVRSRDGEEPAAGAATAAPSEPEEVQTSLF